MKMKDIQEIVKEQKEFIRLQKLLIDNQETIIESDRLIIASLERQISFYKKAYQNLKETKLRE